MLTHTIIQSPAAAYPRAASRRSIDPVSAQILARYARQEAMLRLLGALGRAVAAAVAGFFRRQALYRDLRAMPDHLLNDIGLRRDQVADVACGRLKRAPSILAQAAAADPISFLDAKPAAPAKADEPETHAPLAA